jgi:cytochrome P450
LNFLVKKVLLVSGRNLSAHIMNAEPSERGYVAGSMKRKAMSFLAPQALTISHGEQWKRLRGFNEKVLCTGQPHVYQQEFLDAVNMAFAAPATGSDDLRDAMGKSMLAIVFGAGVAPLRLAYDIQVLFGVVQSPMKRLVASFLQKRRRREFYGLLRKMWNETRSKDGPSLLHLGHRYAGDIDVEEIIQQIPHWMFTFTGSGTDLLSRTLALITSRQEIHAKVLEEIAEQQDLHSPAAIERLHYVEACLLESGRLFSPVPQTFHCAPDGDIFDGVEIPPNMEIVHYLPLYNRDLTSDATADDFRPERWLGLEPNASRTQSNIFLSGARMCPGKDVILFICKSAIAILLNRHKLQANTISLSTDPLPLAFPDEIVRFHVEKDAARSRLGA